MSRQRCDVRRQALTQTGWALPSAESGTDTACGFGFVFGFVFGLVWSPQVAHSNDLGLLPVLSAKDDDKLSSPHLVRPRPLSCFVSSHHLSCAGSPSAVVLLLRSLMAETASPL